MADPPPYSDRGDDTGTPRWVKVFGIIALVVVLLFVVLMLTRGHGPSRHMRPGNTSAQTPPSIIADGQAPPNGGPR